MASVTGNLQNPLDLSPTTASALQQFTRRRRALLILRAFAVGLVVAIAAVSVIAVCDYVWILSDGVRWTLSLIGYAVVGASAWRFGLRHLGQQDPRQIARQLESADPRLRDDLLSAVELADPNSANGSASFRERLQTSVGRRTSMVNVTKLLPITLVKRWMMCAMILVAIVSAMLLIPRAQFARRFARAMLPGLSIQRASLTSLTIVTPDPATGFVAEGDAVGVIVRVGGVMADKVTLQWRMDDGTDGQTPMSIRIAGPATAKAKLTGDEEPSLPRGELFAANVLVGTEPMHYRIVGGDAITLWHTLTPLPRPSVVSYEKRYEFPGYANLDDRIEEAEHGDLEAIIGTRAHLTVRFDEAVEEAAVRVGSRGPEYELLPVDGSREVFRTMIPIKTPTQYQVDATSQRSGLNNPFSPQNTITPIADRPPSVVWSATQATELMVSPLEVVALSAIATDDLPMDRVIQEFQVNNYALVERNVSIPGSDRQIEIDWDWDLLHREFDGQESTKLAGGDIVRVRLVAIDRLGQRGESPFIELLVADEQFDRDRHQRLDKLANLATLVDEWTNRATKLSENLRVAFDSFDPENVRAVQTELDELTGTTDPLMTRIQQQISDTTNLPNARTIELVGRGIQNLDLSLRHVFASGLFAADEQHPAWKEEREKELRSASGKSKSIAAQASRLNQLMRSHFGTDFTIAIASDVSSLNRSLRPLIRAENTDGTKMPFERFGRYLTVIMGRMKEIDRLVERHKLTMPESTLRHFQNQWSRWSESWQIRFEDITQEMRPEGQLRILVESFGNEVMNKYSHGMNDDRLSPNIQSMVRDIQKEIGAIGEAIEKMEQAGQGATRARDRVASEKDSQKAAQFARDANWNDHEFDSTRSEWNIRVQREVKLHRSLPSVDLQYAADLNLIDRAIKNVTENGFVDYRDEPASEVHRALASAFNVIEAVHEVEMGLREVRSLAESERKLVADATAKWGHAMWLEQYAAAMEWPVRLLQKLKLDWKLIEPIDRSRHNEDFSTARDRMSKRRWSSDDMIAAGTPLHALAQKLAAAIATLQPNVAEARATISKYVLTLPEQANKAAKMVEKVKKQVDERSDDSAPTAEELAAQQTPAMTEVTQTLEALVDFANTADLNSAENRELARDADAAVAQIQDAKQRSEDAMAEAKDAVAEDDAERKKSLQEAATAMEELATSLRQTAEHFEKAASGEDVSQSRDELRKAEQELKIADELERRFNQAKTIADAAQSRPEELLKRLEQELKRNQPMQQELSDIAKQAVDQAKKSLEQSARDEAGMNQTLQRSDDAFQETKTRVTKQLADVARRTGMVNDALLNTGKRASESAATPMLKESVETVRQQLKDAVDQTNQMGGENAPLTKIRETAKQMAIAVDQASKQLLPIDNSAADAAEKKPVDLADDQREKLARELERSERDAMNQASRAAGDIRKDWQRTVQEANRRMQAAQRKQRDVKREQGNIQDRIKREPKQKESLEKELARTETQLAEAQQAEAAARQTAELAKLMESQAETQRKEFEKQRLEKLDKPNPAAELSQRMTSRSRSELDEIGETLNEMVKQSEVDDQLRAPAERADALAKQQQRVAGDVNEASETLKRAARHEERLDHQQEAAALDESAQKIDEGATQAASDAAESLDQAAKDAKQSPEASRKIAAAETAIQQAADSLGQQFGDQEPGQPPSQGERPEPSQGDTQPSPTQQRAQQLAQTLDELDRSIAAEKNSEQGSEPSEGENPSDQPPGQEPGDNPGQQPGQKPGQSKPSTAAEASPTLAGLVEAQSQAAAKQRQERIDPPAPSQGPPSPPSDQPSPPGEPGDESKVGEMPDGGTVDSRDTDRNGIQWGELRQRRTDDAAESAAPNVPIQYRREIEAYFRAIANQAAGKGKE
ncbi:hypothetical protein [Rubripirellula reticaptiva]|uniref:Uncharacterized protein n=1 Tax=Rubripirellula reticaptiva TaxID=2528013 RepID=A0A5C6EU42_9BACT|nr:hypothetical protein [Rubripirellula reticaptiva]TWU51904.1 hypothetical protein Poly59_35000 [Rubripirellula reticaptiva]